MNTASGLFLPPAENSHSLSERNVLCRISLFLLTWQILHQRPELQQSVNVIFKGPVGNSRYCRVRLGASQLLLSDSLAGHSLDHVGAGDEEVGGVLHHKREVSEGRRVDGAPGTGTLEKGAI